MKKNKIDVIKKSILWILWAISIFLACTTDTLAFFSIAFILSIFIITYDIK